MASLIPLGISVAGGILGKGSKNREAEGIAAAGREGAAQFQPFQEAGAGANADILAALQGGQGADANFQNFLNSTGFQSQLAAGSQAITGNAATEGLLNSGSTLKRLNTFGQDLAQGGFQNFLGNLGGVANRGLSAAGGAAQSLTGTGVRAAETRGAGADRFQSGLGAAAQQGVDLIPDRFF